MNQDKFENLKAMHTLMMSMNDENAYFNWTYIIPDDADDEELRWIAENDEDRVAAAVACFIRYMNLYSKDGYWIYVIPDGADDGELRWIAGNDKGTFSATVDCFVRIWNPKLTT